VSVSPCRIGGYLKSIEAMTPLVEEHRTLFDRERRLPEIIVAALADAGLFRLWLPAALGGPELSPIEFLSVVEAASALDGSVGWLVANGGGMSRVGGYLAEPVVRDWFAEPRAFIAAATGAIGSAAPVEGGYRVTGRWPFGSGAHHASRFMGLASVIDGNRPPMCCYFQREAVTIHDTWHVSGLRGTGSCDFEVNDAFVPISHAHDLMTPVPTQPGSLYRIPGLSIFPWSIAGAPLGIASGAMTVFTKLATQSKTRMGTTVRLQDREIVQSAVGRAAAMLGAARAFLAETMGQLMESIAIGDDQQLQARANLRTACALAAENSSAVVQMLAAEAGAVSIFETCGLERAVRDINAAVKHVAMSPQSYIVVGRLRLGLDSGTFRF
jgi:alkylation response protein AidB-like acyl-CoA dehydrogenase